MKVKEVVCAAGRSGYMHRDLDAIKSGIAIPDGNRYEMARTLALLQARR